MTTKRSGKSKSCSIICWYCLMECNNRNYNFLSDEKQVYENMVKDTFNIQICNLKSYNKMICLKCVEDIRLAAEAKKKILNAQKILEERSEELFKLDCDLVKQEMDSNCDGFGSEDRRHDDIDKMMRCDNDDDVILNNEEVNENITHSKEVFIKLESVDMKEKLTHKKRRKTTKNASKTEGLFKEKVYNTGTDEENTKSIKPSQTRESIIYLESESEGLKYMKMNSIKLLFNSNMILFKSKRTAFGCYTCKKTYFDIRQLREHSQTHTIKNNIINNLSRSHGLTYHNVDISNLACAKCLSPCRDLNDLREHLESVHEEVFKSTEHLFVPYKLEAGFKCALCEEPFFTFCRLSIHMNSHSTSNVCETCGIAYTSRLGLRGHINSTHTEQKCPKCFSVFPNKSAKARHLRLVHNNVRNYKRYCLRCEMTFRYGYQLSEHMVLKHGAKRQTGKCEHCGKEFPTLTAVKIHVRSVHVGERNYPCSICDKRCFTSFDKRRHERTHRNEKCFSCNFCEVKFKSKDSVRRHLKRQHAVT